MVFLWFSYGFPMVWGTPFKRLNAPDAPHLLGHLGAVGEPLGVGPGLHDLEEPATVGKTWENMGENMD